MYNATLYNVEADGRLVSTCVGTVDGDGFVLASNALQTYDRTAGTREYHARFLAARPSWAARTLYVPGTGSFRKGIASGFRFEVPGNAVEIAGAEL